MRRNNRSLLFFMLGVALVVFYCEFLIYYVVIAQCSWLPISNGPVLNALILSDPHMLGPSNEDLFVKIRREWQMYRAFQTIIHLHYPDVVFVLGDLFDEGDQMNDYQFLNDVDRFYQVFALPKNIEMYVVPGNHDIGFHYYIIHGNKLERFTEVFNTSTVQFLTIKGSHFLLLNSMAMEGDSCNLCLEAKREIENISDRLKCSKSPDLQCADAPELKHGRPILLQHFPLFRLSEAPCTEPDSAPLREKIIKFRSKIDAISKEATHFLVSKLKPRVVIGGHTHHGCQLHHKYNDTDFWEFSVPSFSWKNRPDPKYMLMTISPDSYAINKCGLPKETTNVMTFMALLSLLIIYINRRQSRMFRV